MSLRPTGTPPDAILPLQTLRIDADVPMPAASCSRGVVRNTLAVMQPGQSFLIGGTSLSNIYKWAKKLRIRIRVKRLAGEARAHESRYRIWRTQ